MEDIQRIHLKRLHGQVRQIAYQLMRVQFSHFTNAQSWSPAINAYRCREQITICVDLSGVDKSLIEVRAEAECLRIRGRREPPEPCGGDKPLQVLAMEIDYGPFEREVLLPEPIQTEQVRAEQQNGLLWVYLPLRPQA